MSTPADVEQLTKLSELFDVVTSSAQTLNGGFLSVDSADSATVQLVWSKRDLINSASVRFHTQYAVRGLDTMTPGVRKSAVPAAWDFALTSVSPSKKFVVALKLEKAGDAMEAVFHVFADGELVRTFKAPSSLHGNVYTGAREGGISWSHDETRIAYVAEKKAAESAPFYENINLKKEKTPDDKDAMLPGNKYEQEDDWGEQYVGKKIATVLVATLATGKIEEVKGIPPNLTCTDVLFAPGDKELVFVGTEVNAPKRLGMVYCYNRPSTLYTIDLVVAGDETPVAAAQKLVIKPLDEASTTIASIRSPRFSPDGKKLAFLATRDVVTHDTCSLLAVLDWETKETTTIIDVVEEPEPNYTHNPLTAFNGLFLDSLSKKAWSQDSKYIFFDTQLGARTMWKYVDVATTQIIHPAFVDGDKVGLELVLDRAPDGWHLVWTASPVRAPSVYLVQLDLVTGQVRVISNRDRRPDQQG